MDVREIAVSDLNMYENNSRNNDKAIEAVTKSIEQFGFKVPIVIDKDNVIICGHTRYKAAQKIGLEKIPCIIADDLTLEQVRAFRLIENKTSELANWDFEKLGAELSSLSGDLYEEFHFTLPETETLRLADNTPSRPLKDFETMNFYFTAEQKEFVEKELTKVESEIQKTFDNPDKKGNSLYVIVKDWLRRRSNINGSCNK